MSVAIRDLEHHFHVHNRIYAVQVCGCGHHPAPVSPGSADVVLVDCVPDELLDRDDDAPEKIVRQVIDHAKPRLPAAITPEQWGEFSDAVHSWVCEHRRVAAQAAHKND